MPKILGIDTVERINPDKMSGLIPIGCIIPVMVTGLTGAQAIPGSGVILDGLMLCNGAAIPGGAVLTGNTPNITSGRFIMGHTTAGTIGGSNTKTLTAPELPLHAHPITVDAGNAPHSHPASTGAANMPHDHPGGAPAGPVSPPHTHDQFTFYNNSPGPSSRVDYDADGTSYRFPMGDSPGTSPNVSHSHPGATSSDSEAPGTTPSVHSHPMSVGSTTGIHTHPGSIGTAGMPAPTQTSFNTVPSFIDAVYLIRVR
jgi:hypothetical protein